MAGGGFGQLDAVIDEYAGDLSFCLAFGKLELGVLELHQTFTEEIARFRIIDGVFKRDLAACNSAYRDDQPLPGQLGHQIMQPFAFVTEAV